MMPFLLLNARWKFSMLNDLKNAKLATLHRAHSARRACNQSINLCLFIVDKAEIYIQLHFKNIIIINNFQQFHNRVAAKD